MSALKQRGYRFAAVRPGSAGDSIVLPPIPFGTAGTLEARVQLGPSGVGRRILNFDASASAKVLEIGHNESQLTAIVNDGTTNRTLTSAGIDPDDNVERWLALVFDAAGIRLYVDGVQVGVSAGASPWVPWTSVTGTIGNYSPQPVNSNGITGWMADVRIWDRALTPAELAPYRPRLRGDEPGLLAWYPLEVDTLDRSVEFPSPTILDSFTRGSAALPGRVTEDGSATWVRATGGDGTGEVVDGALRFVGNTPLMVVPTPASYRVSARVAAMPAASHAIRLAFRVSTTADFLYFRGDTSIVRIASGGQTIPGAGGSAWQVGDRIAVEVDGATFRCYRNGAIVFTGALTPLEQGMRLAGFFVSSDSSGMWDDFALERIPSRSHGAARTGAGPSIVRAVA